MTTPPNIPATSATPAVIVESADERERRQREELDAVRYAALGPLLVAAGASDETIAQHQGGLLQLHDAERILEGAIWRPAGIQPIGISEWFLEDEETDDCGYPHQAERTFREVTYLSRVAYARLRKLRGYVAALPAPLVEHGLEVEILHRYEEQKSVLGSWGRERSVEAVYVDGVLGPHFSWHWLVPLQWKCSRTTRDRSRV